MINIMNNSDGKKNFVKPEGLNFPWGFSIGKLLAENDQFNAILPTAAGGLLVTYDSRSSQAATQIIETAVLSLYDALPNRALEVHVIDYSIRKRFQNLSRLAAIKHYRLYDNSRAASTFMADMDELARYRHHELLSETAPTISAYNQSAQQTEKYIVIVLNLNDFPGNTSAQIDQLLRLTEASLDAGLFIVAHANVDMDINDDASQASEKVKVPFKVFSQRYPYVKLEISPDGQLDIRLNKGIYCDGLLAAVVNNGYTLIGPADNSSELVDFRCTTAANSDVLQQDFLEVPVGRSKDGRREVQFSLGSKSDCHHAFIVGRSGSGKTTLLNNIIVNIAKRYTSDEMRLYLMDYKDGVEFQQFARHPNCVKIFLDNSNRQAADSMLKEFQSAISERATMFRELHVKDIDDYNTLPEISRLARLVLIVDEVQCLFTTDAAGRQFNELLKDVVKRGRAFGVHLILCTQTLINANIDKDLMSQISLRVAFRVNSDTDCDKIFNYGNTAPQFLEKYEFIYNADSGHKEANLRAQASPPPDIDRELEDARRNLPSEKCLIPDIFTKMMAGSTTSEASATSAAAPVKANNMGNSRQNWPNPADNAEKQNRTARHEQILSELQKMPPS